jgi:hypothetical protein
MVKFDETKCVSCSSRNQANGLPCTHKVVDKKNVCINLRSRNEKTTKESKR